MKTGILAILILSCFNAFAGGSSTIGTGNPASVNCVKLGGKLETINNPDGESTVCAIEEWTLYREMEKRGLLKKHDYQNEDGSIGMPNPAAVNCKDVEGTIRIETHPQGQSGICLVEQWTLFKYINVVDEE